MDTGAKDQGLCATLGGTDLKAVDVMSKALLIGSWPYLS
jgi:hypothetical protein